MSARKPVRTWVELPFGDGLYRFQLGWKNLTDLEEVLGVGFGAIYGTLARGRYQDSDGEFGVPAEAAWRSKLLLETIRHALIGGNRGVIDGGEKIEVPPGKATALVNAYVVGRPLREAWDFAFAAAHGAMCGYSEDGEPEPISPDLAAAYARAYAQADAEASE